MSNNYVRFDRIEVANDLEKSAVDTTLRAGGFVLFLAFMKEHNFCVGKQK